MYMQTTVLLTDEHKKLIDQNCLNLTKFLRMKLEEHFANASGLGSLNSERGRAN